MIDKIMGKLGYIRARKLIEILVDIELIQSRCLLPVSVENFKIYEELSNLYKKVCNVIWRSDDR